MTPQGPPPPGGGPDDDAGDRGWELPDDGAEPTGPQTRLRGWLPPDDRLWRHPSEMLAGRGAPGPGPRRPPADRGPWSSPPGPTLRTPHRPRHHAAATVLVGSAAAAMVAVGLLLLVGSSMGTGPDPLATGGGAARTTALTVVTGCCRVVPSAERDASQAMVSLQVTDGHRTTQDCGVVVAGGGLVVTTLDAVAGARSVTAVTAGGRRVPATLVAGDPASDIALLRVPVELPVAPFASDSLTAATRRAIVLALSSGGPVGGGEGGSGDVGEPTDTMWATGTIRSVGTAVARGDASGLAGIEADAGATPDMAGEVLLEPDGRVLGILDRTGGSPGDPGTRTFLPSQLVVGVAEALAASGQVDHGWLDIEGTDAPSPAPSAATTTTDVRRPGGSESTTASALVHRDPGGALVLDVERGGASAGVLRPGDVIRSIDGHAVRSMAELRDRLYVLPPGTRVVLQIERGGVPRTVAVHLSPSP